MSGVFGGGDFPEPLRYYDLESYLFVDVHETFHFEGSIGAFDFFSIVIWKANRAKSKIAKRLQKMDPGGRIDLELIVRDLTSSLFDAASARDRLRILMQTWGFRLPMASAILTVLCCQRVFVPPELYGAHPNCAAW